MKCFRSDCTHSAVLSPPIFVPGSADLFQGIMMEFCREHLQEHLEIQLSTLSQEREALLRTVKVLEGRMAVVLEFASDNGFKLIEPGRIEHG